MIVVHPSVPATTLAGLVAYASAHPGALNYGSTGVGSSTQLDAEMFAERAGIRITHIPIRGPQQVNAALIAGDIQVSLSSITSSIGPVRAGQARALAVIGNERSPLLPDVPTIAEAGLPGLEIRTWIGVVAPLRTPPAVIARLNAEFNTALADPALRQWMELQGWEPIGGSSADFARTLAADNARWAAEIRKLGLAADAR
jgi:tripartite-type tricarboxylate transporter receptor subunit TctC